VIDIDERPSSPMRSVLISSSVLSLALLGDALIYAVLPVHAASFDISLVWVGVLLSANRFIRVLAYGWVARATAHIGMRRMCIAAATASVASTAAYGLGDGPAVLLGARLLWGLAYAALVLVTLAYAVAQRSGAGARIGWSRSVQRIGPVFALVAGAWLTGMLGPQRVFVVLAVLTALALPLAMSLPPDPGDPEPAPRTPSLGRPRPVDALFFLLGMGVDGVFAVSITLILAEEHALSVAVFSGGVLLAMRHLTEALAAPLFGSIADRFGAARVFVFATLMTAAGFAGVALGATVTGALVMLVFRGALAALGAATIVETTGRDRPVLAPLARMQAWRDLGAAIGPLGTGYALGLVSAQLLHGLLGVLTCAALVHWMRSRSR
jgi:MFS family permease